MATSLVTGGAGFLGSHLVDKLVKRGDEVVVFDNLTTGRLANLADAISSGRVTFVYADVATDTGAIQNILSRANVGPKIDTIYHAASPSGQKVHRMHPWETLAVNALGTMSLIEIALERRARFVFISSADVYGCAVSHPQSETDFGNVDPVGIDACFDEGKRFGEAAVATAVQARGLDGRIIRLFECYGPRMQRDDGGTVAGLLESVVERRPFAIPGSGDQLRSVAFVADVIDAIVLIAGLKTAAFEPINVGDDRRHSVADIARVIAEILSVEFSAEFNPSIEVHRSLCPDLSRARALGWSAKTTLEAGLRATSAWYMSENQIFV